MVCGSPLRFGNFWEITIRYDFTQLFNKVATHTVELAQRKGLLIEKFVLDDICQTSSTNLHKAAYNFDRIEKALIHKQRGVRSVYNKVEYA